MITKASLATVLTAGLLLSIGCVESQLRAVNLQRIWHRYPLPRFQISSRAERFAILFVVVVLSLTCGDAFGYGGCSIFNYVDCLNPVRVTFAEINSVGSVEPYVLINTPFEIAVDGCIYPASPGYYGYYIEHTAGYVP